MPRLPLLSGRDVVKVFESLGWQVARQSSSHVIMVREGQTASLSVPNHKEVARGILRGLLRSANITAAEFLAAI